MDGPRHTTKILQNVGGNLVDFRLRSPVVQKSFQAKSSTFISWRTSSRERRSTDRLKFSAHRYWSSAYGFVFLPPPTTDEVSAEPSVLLPSRPLAVSSSTVEQGAVGVRPLVLTPGMHALNMSVFTGVKLIKGHDETDYQ